MTQRLKKTTPESEQRLSFTAKHQSSQFYLMLLGIPAVLSPSGPSASPLGQGASPLLSQSRCAPSFGRSRRAGPSRVRNLAMTQILHGFFPKQMTMWKDQRIACCWPKNRQVAIRANERSVEYNNDGTTPRSCVRNQMMGTFF